eukprot:Lithocolla_globosa_v1_NODE_88_length_6608_cov_12.657409.p2 type:complete len:326 gc:universal NODE_88_length_6608_cov_12.657409:6249-5272(-)
MHKGVLKEDILFALGAAGLPPPKAVRFVPHKKGPKVHCFMDFSDPSEIVQLVQRRYLKVADGLVGRVSLDGEVPKGLSYLHLRGFSRMVQPWDILEDIRRLHLKSVCGISFDYDYLGNSLGYGRVAFQDHAEAETYRKSDTSISVGGELTVVIKELLKEPSYACFTCGEQGHVRSECTKKKKFEGICFSCGNSGHIRKNCHLTKCYRCNRNGHMASDCTEPKQDERSCFNCGEVGHLRKNCSQTICYRCKGNGHMAKDCKRQEEETSCFHCGEEGHLRRNCTSRTPAKKRIWSLEELIALTTPREQGEQGEAPSERVEVDSLHAG